MSPPDVVPEKTTDRTTERCVVQKFDKIDDMSRNFPDMSGKGATKVVLTLLLSFLLGKHLRRRFVMVGAGVNIGDADIEDGLAAFACVCPVNV